MFDQWIGIMYIGEPRAPAEHRRWDSAIAQAVGIKGVYFFISFFLFGNKISQFTSVNGSRFEWQTGVADVYRSYFNGQVFTGDKSYQQLCTTQIKYQNRLDFSSWGKCKYIWIIAKTFHKITNKRLMGHITYLGNNSFNKISFMESYKQYTKYLGNVVELFLYKIILFSRYSYVSHWVPFVTE